MLVMHHPPLAPHPRPFAPPHQYFGKDPYFRPEGYTFRPFEHCKRRKGRTFSFCFLLSSPVIRSWPCCFKPGSRLMVPLTFSFIPWIRSPIVYRRHLALVSLLISKEDLQRDSRQRTLGLHRPNDQHEFAPDNLLQAP